MNLNRRQLDRVRLKAFGARIQALEAQLTLAHLLGDRHPAATALGRTVAAADEALRQLDDLARDA